MRHPLPDRSAVSALLSEFARLGIAFSRKGDGLRCVRAGGAIDPQLVARTKPHKWLLLALATLRDDVKDKAFRESLCSRFDEHATASEASGRTREESERAAFEMLLNAISNELTAPRTRAGGAI